MLRNSGGKRLNHPKKVLCCNVAFLDDAVATYEIPKDSKGSVLMQSVIRSLELGNESIYFGLLFKDADNFPVWLDPNKKIKSQVKSPPPFKFEFRVKYYVSEPGIMLTDELTRYQYVLQLKQDLYNQRLSCTFRTLALLASYIVQSELGDYDPHLHRSGYLKEFKFIPNQPSDLEQEIAELHAMHTGLTPEEVELRYLEKAKWLTGYGVDVRRVNDCHGTHLKMGIAPAGIQLYHNDALRVTYEWPRISKLRFTQKKFFIKVQPKEPGSKEQEHCYMVPKTKQCKLLWKTCLEHHGFYKSLPPIDRTATLLRTSSQRVRSDGSASRANIRSDSFRTTTPSATTPSSRPAATTPTSRPAATTPTTRPSPGNNTTAVTPSATKRPPPPPTSTSTAITPPSRQQQQPLRQPDYNRSRDMSRDMSRDHTSRDGYYHRSNSGGDYHRTTMTLSRDQVAKSRDQMSKSRDAIYAREPFNSLPRYQHEPKTTLTTRQPRDMSRDVPRHQSPDKSYYEKNITTSYNGYGTGGYTRRSKSIGAADTLDLDYPGQHAPYPPTKRPAYAKTPASSNGAQFREFFNDTVLQNRTQYTTHGSGYHHHGKSWASNVNNNDQYRSRSGGGGGGGGGVKSTPDIRMAASQPAFTNRSNNFLMTTEL